jgi:hypothetical protein
MAWQDDWGRKVVITVKGTIADSSQDYFPVLITQPCMPDEVMDSDEANKAQADGGDLRFFMGDYSGSDPNAEDHADRIPCEIVDFSQHSTPASATAEIWVTPTAVGGGATPGDDVEITMYYNATGKSQPAEGDPFGKHETWDENGADNFKMVHHLSGASATALDDSTSNNHDVTGDRGTPVYNQTGAFEGGTVGDAVTLVAASEESLTVPSFIAAWTEGTVSVWFKAVDATPAEQEFLYCGGSYRNFDRLYFFIDDSGHIGARLANEAEFFGTTGLNDNTWYRGSIAWDTSGAILYLNGVSDGTGNDGTAGDADAGGIGAFYDIPGPQYSNFFDGSLDEVSISNNKRTVQWLLAEYRNQNAPATYVVEGTPGDVAAGPTAALTGTLTTDSPTEADIRTGGKTLIITLTDDEWTADVGDDHGDTEALIAGIDGDVVAGTGWDAEVKANMVFGDVTREVDDVTVTIELQAEAGYDIAATETITVTIPAAALVGGEEVEADTTFEITSIDAPTKRKQRMVGRGIGRGIGRF